MVAVHDYVYYFRWGFAFVSLLLDCSQCHDEGTGKSKKVCLFEKYQG